MLAAEAQTFGSKVEFIAVQRRLLRICFMGVGKAGIQLMGLLAFCQIEIEMLTGHKLNCAGIGSARGVGRCYVPGDVVNDPQS